MQGAPQLLRPPLGSFNRTVCLRQTQFGFARGWTCPRPSGIRHSERFPKTQPERSGRLSKRQMANFFKTVLPLADVPYTRVSRIIVRHGLTCQSKALQRRGLFASSVVSRRRLACRTIGRPRRDMAFERRREPRAKHRPQDFGATLRRYD